MPDSLAPTLTEAELVRKLERNSMPEPNSGCVLWLAGTSQGYGTFANPGGDRSAHRAAWMLKHGPIPAGMQVLHKCDVRLCVNPDHLFLGTIADNMTDKARKRRALGKLTADAALAIYRDARPGRQIAREHGVAEGVVRGIRNGWYHQAVTGAPIAKMRPPRPKALGPVLRGRKTAYRHGQTPASQGAFEQCPTH